MDKKSRISSHARIHQEHIRDHPTQVAILWLRPDVKNTSRGTPPRLIDAYRPERVQKDCPLPMSPLTQKEVKEKRSAQGPSRRFMADAP